MYPTTPAPSLASAFAALGRRIHFNSAQGPSRGVDLRVAGEAPARQFACQSLAGGSSGWATPRLGQVGGRIRIALWHAGEESNPAPETTDQNMSRIETNPPTPVPSTTPKAPWNYTSKEWKLVALRECPLPEEMQICDTPELAAQYWRLHIQTHPYFDPERENFVVLILNTRRRIRGHQLVSIGTMDTLLIHPRDVFRIAIAAPGSAAIIVLHNHPSGDPTPSDADIRVTRDLIKAGQLLRIELLDHIIIGAKHLSLRSFGYFQ